MWKNYEYIHTVWSMLLVLQTALAAEINSVISSLFLTSTFLSSVLADFFQAVRIVCACVYIYIYKRITCSNFPGGLLHAQERQAWGETEGGLPKEHRSQFYPSWTSICQAWCGCGQNDRQVHGNLRSWKSSRVHLQDFPVQGGCRLLVRYHAQSHAKRQVGWEFGNSTKSWSNQESNGSSSWEDPQGKHQHGRWDQQEVCPKGNRGERLFRSNFHQEEWSATTFKNPGVQAIAGSDFAHCRGACCWGLRPCYVAFNSWMASSDMHLDGRQVHRKQVDEFMKESSLVKVGVISSSTSATPPDDAVQKFHKLAKSEKDALLLHVVKDKHKVYYKTFQLDTKTNKFEESDMECLVRRAVGEIYQVLGTGCQASTETMAARAKEAVT